MTREERRAREATFPKCPCGNTLGLERVNNGIRVCSGCENKSARISESTVFSPGRMPLWADAAEYELYLKGNGEPDVEHEIIGVAFYNLKGERILLIGKDDSDAQ